MSVYNNNVLIIFVGMRTMRLMLWFFLVLEYFLIGSDYEYEMKTSPTTAQCVLYSLHTIKIPYVLSRIQGFSFHLDVLQPFSSPVCFLSALPPFRF